VTVVVLWLIAGLALVLALAALAAVRRMNRRLEAMKQSYWELRYDFTRLRSQVSRLDADERAEEPPPAPAGSQVTFVPLSSIKKKNG
jgi:hypothetical protein